VDHRSSTCFTSIHDVICKNMKSYGFQQSLTVIFNYLELTGLMKHGLQMENLQSSWKIIEGLLLHSTQIYNKYVKYKVCCNCFLDNPKLPLLFYSVTGYIFITTHPPPANLFSQSDNDNLHRIMSIFLIDKTKTNCWFFST